MSAPPQGGTLCPLRAPPRKVGALSFSSFFPDTGIGKWDEAFFLKKFTDYKLYAVSGTPALTGPEQFTLMPWLTFSGMAPEDLSAIYTYLRTVKPIDHHVDIHPESK